MNSKPALAGFFLGKRFVGQDSELTIDHNSLRDEVSYRCKLFFH